LLSLNIKMKTKKIYQGAFHLPIETAVYVPSTNKSQNKISKQGLNKRVNIVRKDLSQRYGGYTSVKGVGGYIMKNGKLVKEDMVKVTAFTTRKSFNQNKTPIKKKIVKWKNQWGQESIGYEHEGDLYYIK